MTAPFQAPVELSIRLIRIVFALAQDCLIVRQSIEHDSDHNKSLLNLSNHRGAKREKALGANDRLAYRLRIESWARRRDLWSCSQWGLAKIPSILAIHFVLARTY